MSAVKDFLKKASPKQLDEVRAVATEMVAKILQDREDSMVKLAQLEGEVMVHSTVAHLGMFKENFDKGLCWMCGERRPSIKSYYLKCDNCEESE